MLSQRLDSLAENTDRKFDRLADAMDRLSVSLSTSCLSCFSSTTEEYYRSVSAAILPPVPKGTRPAAFRAFAPRVAFNDYAHTGLSSAHDFAHDYVHASPANAPP